MREWPTAATVMLSRQMGKLTISATRTTRSQSMRRSQGGIRIRMIRLRLLRPAIPRTYAIAQRRASTSTVSRAEMYYPPHGGQGTDGGGGAPAGRRRAGAAGAARGPGAGGPGGGHRGHDDRAAADAAAGSADIGQHRHGGGAAAGVALRGGRPQDRHLPHP